MTDKSNVSEEKHQKLVAKLKADKFHGVLETHFVEGNIVRVVGGEKIGTVVHGGK
jgi:hypothetical protein